MDKQGNTQQAFWVGLGSLSSFALGIVSAAILSRYFDKQEYGTYRQILYVYNTLLIIFSAGLPRVYAYYLPRYSKEEGRSIVNKVSFLLFCFGLFFSVMLLLFSSAISVVLKNPELEIGLKYFSPIPMLLLPTLGIEGIFSTYKKTHFIAIYNSISRLLMLAFIVGPVIFFKGSYITAVYGWIIASFLTLGLAIYFMSIPFKNTLQKKVYLPVKEILGYSLPIMAAGISGIMIKSADQFFISRYFGTDTFAEYANGFIQLPFVTMITGATSVVLMPAFSKMIHEKDSIDNIIRLWNSAMSQSAILIYPMVIFFIWNADDIVVLLYSETYVGSVVYFQIAMILNFFNIIIFAPLMFSLGETKFYFKIHFIFAFITWAGMYALVHIIHTPIAIAVFSVLNSILLVFFCIYKTAHIFKVKVIQFFPLRDILTIILHAVLVILLVSKVSNWVKLDSDFVNLALKGLLFGILLISTGKLLGVKYLNSALSLLKKKK